MLNRIVVWFAPINGRSERVFFNAKALTTSSPCICSYLCYVAGLDARKAERPVGIYSRHGRLRMGQ